MSLPHRFQGQHTQPILHTTIYTSQPKQQEGPRDRKARLRAPTTMPQPTRLTHTLNNTSQDNTTLLLRTHQASRQTIRQTSHKGSQQTTRSFKAYRRRTQQEPNTKQTHTQSRQRVPRPRPQTQLTTISQVPTSQFQLPTTIHTNTIRPT